MVTVVAGITIGSIQHNQMERFLPPTSPLKSGFLFFLIKHLLSCCRQGKETLSFSPPNQPSSDFNKHGKNGTVRSRNQWRISQVLKTATEQEHMYGQRNSSKTFTELNLLMCSKGLEENNYTGAWRRTCKVVS